METDHFVWDVNSKFLDWLDCMENWFFLDAFENSFLGLIDCIQKVVVNFHDSLCSWCGYMQMYLWLLKLICSNRWVGQNIFGSLLFLFHVLCFVGDSFMGRFQWIVCFAEGVYFYLLRCSLCKRESKSTHHWFWFFPMLRLCGVFLSSNFRFVLGIMSLLRIFVFMFCLGGLFMNSISGSFLLFILTD